MSQPTAQGRLLRMLAALPDGRLALGYGDYGANTGPIDLLALEPQTGAWTVLYEAMPTEAIDTARVIDGHLWVPSIDPVGSGPGTLVTNSPSGTWRLVTATVTGKTALHLFDAIGVSTTRYVCGSRSITPGEGGGSGSAAMVWKTTDGGTTWTEDVAYLGDGSNPNLRFYGFSEIDGTTYVSASDLSHHWSLDGGTWTEHAGPAAGVGVPPVLIGDNAYWTNGETVYQLATA